MRGAGQLAAASGFRLATALVLLGLFGLGFLPLLAGPTYEFGLVAGLVCPLVLGPVLGLHLCQFAARPRSVVERALSAMASVAAGLSAVALIHGLRVGFCDFWGQLGLFVLGPLSGLFVTGGWAAAVTLLTAGLIGRSQPLMTIILCVAGPLGGVAISLLRYYTSPIIFAFDPFVGYFAGTLYDTVIDGTPRLLTYRLGSLGALTSLFAVCVALERRRQHPRGWVAMAGDRWMLAALGGIVVAGGVFVNGPELGHYQTAQSVRLALGRAARFERCEVVYSSQIPAQEAHLLARDCDAHLTELGDFFGVRPPSTVTVYLFASSRQKAHLMGARHVYIAKPWRKEVYLQQGGFPHSSLGHELAHVVAGVVGQGPFRIAGPLGGWIPDPGRIEGIAVAAAPSWDSQLSPRQWTRAMQRLELLPRLSNVFRLSFLGQNSSTAYTVAGAFVGWLHEVYGASRLNAWYGGVSLEAAYGKTLTELETEFVGMLDGVTLDERALATARARFERPAVFGRRCPHQVDAILQAARRALSHADTTAARRDFTRALELDPAETGARLGRLDCAYHDAQVEEARTGYLELLADPKLNGPQRAAVERRLGDLETHASQDQRALEHYAAALEAAYDEDELRTTELRTLMVSGTPFARTALRALLLVEPKSSQDWVVTADALARWSENEPHQGIADYLLGKNLLNRGRFQESAEALERALSRKIELPRTRRAALRARIIVACALREWEAGGRALQQYLSDPEVSAARKSGLRGFARRCGMLNDG